MMRPEPKTSMCALHLKRMSWFAFLTGLTIFVLLLGYYGIGDIAAALAVAGASGLALIAAIHLVPLASEAMGWGFLFDRAGRPNFRTLLWGRWIGEAVDTLLPVVQVGGNLVRIRLFMKLGLSATVVAASLVADTTLSVVTLIGFTLLGLVVLTSYVTADGLVMPIFLAMVVLSILIGGFYVAQQRGLFGLLARLLQNFVGSLDATLLDSANAIDQETRRIYARRKDVLHSASWLAAAWLLGTLEVWLALQFLGYPMSLVEAFLIESLVQGVRTSAFLIPGALGIQEGGFLVVGALLSLPAEVALALALTRRIRELAFGIPGILAWQWFEVRSQWYPERRAQVFAKGGESGSDNP
jgi:putative membrane protein